jgi:hypothetical protein
LTVTCDSGICRQENRNPSYALWRRSQDGSERGDLPRPAVIAATTQVINPTGNANTNTKTKPRQAVQLKAHAPARHKAHDHPSANANAQVQIGNARRSRQRLTHAPNSQPPSKVIIKKTSSIRVIRQVFALEYAAQGL